MAGRPAEIAASLQPVDIRRSTAEDVPGLRACLDSVARERRFLAMLEAPSLEEVEAFAAHPDVVQLVAVEAGRVVGWADVRRMRGAGLAHRGSLGMGLLASHRRRGLGGRLLAAVLAESRSLGVTRVELQVFRSNAVAVRLYERQGFVVEGQQKRARVLDGVADDIVLMCRWLPKDEGN
jgi:ribosomal protein S18 acetylase RimI-like enzyme